MGLKKFRRKFDEEGNPVQTRKPEWNRPNRKTLAKLKARQAAYDKMIAEDQSLVKAFHRPGSMNRGNG